MFKKYGFMLHLMTTQRSDNYFASTLKCVAPCMQIIPGLYVIFSSEKHDRYSVIVLCDELMFLGFHAYFGQQ